MKKMEWSFPLQKSTGKFVTKSSVRLPSMGQCRLKFDYENIHNFAFFENNHFILLKEKSCFTDIIRFSKNELCDRNLIHSFTDFIYSKLGRRREKRNKISKFQHFSNQCVLHLTNF